MQSKQEAKFLKRMSKHKKEMFYNDTNAVMEGFMYFKTEEYKNKPHAVKNRAKSMMTSHEPKEVAKLVNHMRKKIFSMFKNIGRNFTDMEPYIKTLEKTGAFPKTPEDVILAYPNRVIWEELKKEVWEKYRVIVGFTKVPQEYIFEGKAIPFRYALVFAQEMQKEPIEQAPQLEAGMEVVNVYNSLGIATNEINRWLREKYGIVGMANHPLGGLVDFIPLAQKAGLGKIGRHGLLITKEFGPRCRISPIFIDQPLFEETGTIDHDWIKSFCTKCGSCVRNCPTGAIYEAPIHAIAYNNEEVEDRYLAFDREKCFTSFSAHMGCGICIKSCPFSKNPATYDKMKAKYS